jgi:transposase
VRTGQELPDDLATYLGLQGFEVESVEVVEAPRPGEPGRRVKVVHLLRRSGLHVCPDCGRGHPEGLFEEFERTRLRDCSIGDFETFLEVRAMRVACCGSTRVERLPFAMEGFRMTRRFFERVAALCTKLPIGTVAGWTALSWDTVARVDKRAIELALGDRSLELKGLRWIGVDEVSRTGGHVYFTIVTNLETGRVVWIGDGKGESGLLPFLEALGPEGRRRLRGVVSDLGYKGAIDTHLPKVVHVLDRFHIVQWINDALNQIRRRMFSAAPKDELGRTLKVKKWVLLSARERLRHSDKLMLRRLMDLNEPLYQAYLIKEQLRGILQHPWRYFGAFRRRLLEWIELAKITMLEELERVANRLEKHIESVIAGHRHGLKLGLVESINSKIAILRAQARGYRDPEYFKLKIFQRCSLPDNPWAKVVL